jgi:hypothetical protein
MSLTAQRYDAFVKWLLDNGSVFNKLELRVGLSFSLYINIHTYTARRTFGPPIGRGLCGF